MSNRRTSSLYTEALLRDEDMREQLDDKENIPNTPEDSPSPRKRKKRSNIGGNKKKANKANMVSHPVILDVDDVVNFTKNIEEKKETISELKDKVFLLKKKIATSEIDKERLIEQNDQHKNNIQLLQSALEQSVKENKQIKDDLSNEQEKNRQMLRRFPISTMHSLTLYAKVRKEEKLNSELSKQTNNQGSTINTLQTELKTSQEHCGHLYLETKQLQQKLEETKMDEQRQIADLERLNQGLRQKLGHQDELYQQVQVQLDLLKQKYFFSCTVAMKLSFQMADPTCHINLNVSDLYEEASKKQVPVLDWDMWISNKILEHFVQK